MTTVDNRVVEMRFDNAHFEKNVSTTMSTLDKLKQKLNFNGVGKSFDNITSASKKCDFAPMAKGIETVQLKFSALQVAGVTAMANITNSVVNAGKNLFNTFAIEPITSGFNEYELKMGSIQTIMASTGESLQTVNKYLNELNKYSDQTIYSFSDMTQNIGKFTNAGVDLERAVLAIKGVSNAAALSGANANEASRAMYNFAQALSSGYVKLIDWKSIENANMATVGFKQQLIDTAVEVGTLTKVTDGYKTAAGTVITPTQNFNDSLQDQWMTTDVLINTLSDYADETTDIGKKATAAATEVKTFSMMMDTLKESAQSGWATTWELIVGDFEEAKSLFTYLTNDVFGPLIDGISDSRNKILERALDGVGSEGKWEAYVKQIEEAGVATEDFQNALLETAKTHDASISDMIKNGASFEDVMKSGKITSDMIVETLWKFVDGANEVSGATQDMTGKLEDMRSVVNKVIKGDFGNGETRMKKLAEAGYEYAEVQALVNKVMAGGKIELSDLSEEQLKSAGYTEEQIKALRELAEQAEKTGVPIEELVEDMNKMSGREMAIATIKNVCEQLGKVLNVIKEAWTEVFGEFDAGEAIYNIIEAIYDFVGTAEITEETLINLKNAFKGFFDALWLVGTLGGGVLNTIRTVLTYAYKAFGFTDIYAVIGWIGQLITGFKNWITTNNVVVETARNAGNAIKSYVETIAGKIRELVDAFFAMEEVQQLIADFKSGIQNVISGIGGWFDGLITIVSEFANKLLESIRNGFDFEEIKGIVKEFFGNLGSHFSGLGKLFGPLIDTIKNFAKAIAEHFSSAGEAASGVIGKIVEVISGFIETIKGYYETIKGWLKENVSFGEVFAILIGVGMIVGILKTAAILNKAFVTMTKLTGSIKGVTDSLSGMFKSFGKAREMEAKSVALRNVAISVAIFAGSLFLLGQMEWGEIGRGVVAMVAITGMLAVLALALGKMSKLDINFAAGSTSILAIAGSIALLAGAFKIFDSLDETKLETSMNIIVRLMIALSGIMIIMSKLAPQLSGGSFALISFAISVGILVHTLNSIGELKVENIEKSFILLVGVIAAMALVSKLCGKVSVGTMFGAIGIAVALKIFVLTLEDLASSDLTGLEKNLVNIITIMGLFAALMIASHFAGKHALKAGISIIAISAAMLILVSVIKMLADISADDVGKATLAIMGVMTIFALVVAASNLAGKYAMQAGAMLILMSGAMVILTAALVVMSKIDPEGLNNGVIAMQKLMIFMSLLIAATSVVPEKVEKTVTMLMVSVGLLAVAVAALSLVDPARLQNATACLSIVLGMFAVIIASTNLMKTGIGNLIVMTGAIALLATAIYFLSEIPVESALGTAASLSILMLSFSGALVIAGKAGKIALKSIPGMIAMTGVIAILALIIGVLAFLNVGPTLEIAASLSILLLALAGACHILVPLGATGPAAIQGALILSGVITILTTVFAALGGLLSLLGSVVSDEAMANLDRGIEFLKKLAYGIGEIAGSILGGFTSGATSGLADIGQNLSDFMTSVKPFLDGAKTITEDSMAGVKMLAETLHILTEASLLESLNFGGDALTNFTNQLPALGEALSAFSTSVAGIDASQLESVAAAGQMLAELANTLPDSGSTVEKWFSGEKNLATFGAQLSYFGQGISQFATTVDGISVENVEKAAAAGQMLADLANTLPDNGSTVEKWFSGEKNLATFGSQLVYFGQGIAQFSTVVENVNGDNVEKAAAAGQVLANLANTLPDNGSTVEKWFSGEKNLATFGTQLGYFGQGIANFSAVVAEVNGENVEKAASAGQILANLANTLPDSGSTVEKWFSGEKNLQTFGTQLGYFGTGIAYFSDAVANVNGENVQKAATAGMAIVELAKALPEDKLFTNETHLDEFGDQLSEFGSGLAGFYNAVGSVNTSNGTAAIGHAKDLANFVADIAGIDTSGVADFKSAINDLAKTNIDDFIAAFSVSLPDLSNVGADMINSIISGFQSKQGALSQSATATVANLIATLNGKASAFIASGATLMQGFASGISQQTSKVMSAILATIAGAIAATTSYYMSFYNAGTYLGSGLVSGINSKKTAAYNAGYALGQASAQGVKDGEKAASPSKEGIKAGKWLGEGVVIGIQKLGRAVYNAGHNLGETAVNSLSNTISKISDAINSDIDSQPTIRPVLDLSDVKSGAGMINSMFGGMTPSMAVVGNVNGINASMNRRIQNGVNSDVVSAIDRLRKDVGNLENKTYSVGNITYGDDSAVANAIETLVRHVRVEGRV